MTNQVAPISRELTLERLLPLSLLDLADLYARKAVALATYDAFWDASDPRYLKLLGEQALIRNTILARQQTQEAQKVSELVVLF